MGQRGKGLRLIELREGICTGRSAFLHAQNTFGPDTMNANIRCFPTRENTLTAVGMHLKCKRQNYGFESIPYQMQLGKYLFY